MATRKKTPNRAATHASLPVEAPVVLPHLSWKDTGNFHHAQHLSHSIRALIDRVMAGAYVLPDFQRPYVWDDARVLRLLDSLRRGYHVGSLIVWRQHLAPRDVDFGGIRVRSAGHGYGVWAVLDGQQRLGALVRACCSGRFSVNLLTAEFLVDAPPGPWLAPVSTIIHPFGGRDWATPLRYWAPIHAKAWGLDQRAVEDVVCEMTSVFDRVGVSMVELDADYTRRDLIEMFRRLAMEGVRVSADDLDRALAQLSEESGG